MQYLEGNGDKGGHGKKEHGVITNGMLVALSHSLHAPPSGLCLENVRNLESREIQHHYSSYVMVFSYFPFQPGPEFSSLFRSLTLEPMVFRYMLVDYLRYLMCNPWAKLLR